MPDGISDQARVAENIRLILRNQTQLTDNLATLRVPHGSAHSKDGNYRARQPRHLQFEPHPPSHFIDVVADPYRERASAK